MPKLQELEAMKRFERRIVVFLVKFVDANVVCEYSRASANLGHAMSCFFKTALYCLQIQVNIEKDSGCDPSVRV